MLIGICGPICSGKHTTAEYLVQHHGFLRLHLPSQAQPRVDSRSAQNTSNTSYDTNEKHFLPSVTDEKGTRGLTFPDVDSLLEFVTKRWREHWVLTDIHDEATLESLLRRPFFLLVSVDAPVSLRYKRFSDRCVKRNLEPISLLNFITTNDFQLYGTTIPTTASNGISTTNNINDSSAPTHPSDGSTPGQKPRINHKPKALTAQPTSPAATQQQPPPQQQHSQQPRPTHGIAPLLSRAHLQILNSTPSITSYNHFLSTLELSSPIRLRPTWDAYFMTLASLASLRSNCMKRRVGCVLVHNSRIISTGYNGTPRNLRNCNEGGCARCNSASTGGSGLSTCLCLHAEENALLEAGRERIREGSVLYCDTCPCLTCSVKIAQVGVKEVVYSQTYNMDEASRRVLEEAGVGLRQFSPPRSGLVSGGDGWGFEMGDELEVGEEGGWDGKNEVVVRNGRSIS